ncbi:MAG: AbrB/MazE/SpoVT family DNA-binding domain-containing protein [Actinomycetota bacterium]|nr:AbrB/MazE/SpoVT family DNA-binding domain-containing protein [Actinomycetota bacterium]
MRLDQIPGAATSLWRYRNGEPERDGGGGLLLVPRYENDVVVESWAFTGRVKVMPRISTKNQITIPVAALDEAGLHAGDQVVVEAIDNGELRVRRGAVTFDSAFGALTGAYPPGYLEQLDAEDEQR